MGPVPSQVKELRSYKLQDVAKKRAKDLNRHLTKEETQMAKKHMKRCSIALIIREIQIKTTPIKMTSLKKQNRKQEDWLECGEIGNVVLCEWECKTVQLLWKAVLWFLKNLKIELTDDPAIPLLGTYQKRIKSRDSKRYLYTHVHRSIFTKAKR